MKTNQKISVKLGGSLVSVEHKTGLVSLNNIFSAGRKIRILNEEKDLNMHQVLKYAQVKRFTKAVKTAIKNGEYRYYDTPNKLIFSRGKGRNAETVAFLPIAVFISGILSPESNEMMIRTFIEGKLLQVRDDGGNWFNKLNSHIDAYLPGCKGKLNNNETYIKTAKIISAKIFPDVVFSSDVNIWNTEKAMPHHHELRTRYEDKLCTFLEMDLVKDWEHMKKLIQKL